MRKADGSGTFFEPVEGEKRWPRDFEHEGESRDEEYQLGECDAGDFGPDTW